MKGTLNIKSVLSVTSQHADVWVQSAIHYFCFPPRPAYPHNIFTKFYRKKHWSRRL